MKIKFRLPHELNFKIHDKIYNLPDFDKSSNYSNYQDKLSRKECKLQNKTDQDN